MRQDGAEALMRAIVRKLGLSRPTVSIPGGLSKSNNINEANIIFEILDAASRHGVMVDVGAHYGGTLGRFAHAGWQVYAFEPDSKNRERLVEQGFGNMPNVHVDARGLADKPSTGIPLYRSEESTGVSGLSAFLPTHMESETVDVTTLEIFSDEHDFRAIDFLKVDTEGFDLFVLQGVPWERFEPQAVLCEFEDRKTVSLGYSFHDLAGYLEQKGYRLVVSEWYPIKRYGITHDWRRFTPYPCELEDPNAWGNILAVKEPLYKALLKTCNLT
ncbi:MAG: FkbM family methyltransferase [Sedimenticola sp.]